MCSPDEIVEEATSISFVNSASVFCFFSRPLARFACKANRIITLNVNKSKI